MWKKILAAAGLAIFIAAALGLSLITVFPLNFPNAASVRGVKISAPASLFSAASSAEKNAVKNLTRWHRALVKKNVLKIKKNSLWDSAGAGKLTLKKRLAFNLFDDVKLIAALPKIKEIAPGKFLGQGSIEGVAGSFATIVATDKLISGNIFLPDKIYEIRGADNGLTVINQVDPKKFPPDDDVTGSMPITNDEPVLPDMSTTTIDVMVAYTKEARQNAGGAAAMESLIDLAVADANMSYENSLIPQKLNLVKTAEVKNFTEPADNNSSAQLKQLKDPSDGVMDEIHQWRDESGADIATLFITNAKKADGTDVCGTGRQMDSDNYENFAADAFNVVPIDCISNLSYPHELGHNMGAGHEEGNAQSSGLYDFSHGLQDPDCKYRTIMAYPCSCAGACTRLPFFSNPDVEYDDWTTGISQQADNGLTLFLTRQTMAGLRTKITPYQPLSDLPRQLLPGAADANISLNMGKETQTLGANFNVALWLGITDNFQSYAQAFTANGPALDGKVTVKAVSFAVRRIGNPPYLVRAALRSSRKGADLAYAAVERSEIPLEPLSDTSWLRVNFSQPIKLQAGFNYYLVLYVPSHDPTNYYEIGLDNITTSGQLYQGDTELDSYNLMAKIHYETVLTAPNLP
jgi:hypothetical protein